MTVDFLPGTEDNYVVCTSSTRPPGREGTMIYETDTDKTYVYNGSVWSCSSRRTRPVSK